MLKRRFMHPLVVALTLVSLLLQGTLVLAGTTGSLSGTVVESGTSTPLANAKVTVTSPSQSVSTNTDASGHFTFASLAPDTYTLSVEKQGYDALSQAGISVFADQNQTVSLSTRRALREIGRVSARAPSDLVKPGTTADVYSVSAAQQTVASALGGGGARDSGYSGIASVPGVYVPQGQNGWAQSVYVRGGNYTQLGYELDGVPVQRAFDQYPGNNVSALGQQELQVYTGAAPASAQSTGLAGFINQVIKTGTYPGFLNADLSFGTPTFYHKGQFEIGGATANRNFSYYVATAGYNQDYRLVSQFSGSDYAAFSPNPYNIIAAGCGTINATSGCYKNASGAGGPAGPSGYALGPLAYNTVSSIADRETIANLHFGIPHKNGSKDDIQLLFDNSSLQTIYGDAVNDLTYVRNAVANGSAFYNGALVPNCGAGGFAGTPCATVGPAGAAYTDDTTYNGPVGVPLTAANLAQTSQYLFPNSSSNRLPGSAVPLAQRDTYNNRSTVTKLQYQKNFGSNAYARLYGYSFYSDWLQNGAAILPISQAGFVSGVSPDYELISHTRGLTLNLADQFNAKNLLNFTGGYTFASTVRWNNRFYDQYQRRVAVLVNSANPTNGLCYTAALAPVYCGSAAVANYSLPPQTTAAAPLSPGHAGADPTLAAASTLTCGGGPCEYFTVESGLSGAYNTVAPRFTNVSLEDSFRPNDRLLVNAGVHYDDFRYDLSDTSTPAGPLTGPVNSSARTLFTNSFNMFNCFSNATGLVAATSPGVCPVGTTLASFSNSSPNANDYHAFEPRLAFTFTADSNDVLRGSYGKYLQPPSTAFEQYGNVRNNIAAADSIFYPVGYTSPAHSVRPEVSYNLDFSWEHQNPRSQLSWKISPFLRKTNDQIFNVLLDPKTNFVSGINVGRETARGVEFEMRKGSFDQNGFAAQLSYTYTWGTVKFAKLPTGTTVVDGVNLAVSQYNAYTSYCASHPKDARCGTGVDTAKQVAAPCYTAAGLADPGCAAGDIANPYWNAPVQGLFDPSSEYIAYNQLPGSGLGGVSGSFVVPHVATLLLNYKHDRFAITPSLQFSGGGRYGSPVEGQGIDPAGGCGALAGRTVGGDPRYPYGAAGGAPFDAQTCLSSITTPNFDTKSFDGFGAYTEPNQLSGNVQIRYDLSKKVSVTLTGVNLIDRCFGGTSAPWTQGVPSNIGCWYGTATYNTGNFYNPGNQIQAFSRSYTPTISNVFQQAYGTATNPFQAFLDLRVQI